MTLRMETFDQIRANVLADRAQFFTDLSAPFYGANRPGATVSQGLRDAFWLQGMQAGFTGVIGCIKATPINGELGEEYQLNWSITQNQYRDLVHCT